MLFCSYELMRNCWLKNPNERPTFTQIHNFLSELLEGTRCDPQKIYSYIRNYTKDIPNCYVNYAYSKQNGSHSEMDSSSVEEKF